MELKTIEQVVCDVIYAGTLKVMPDRLVISPQQITAAMEAYANQIIDKCAEDAQTKVLRYTDDICVDEDSILNVKNLIK